MKKYALLFLTLVNVFSFSCFAQRNQRVPVNARKENTQLAIAGNPNNALAVVSYHVEERINMNFGSRITTYNVTDLSLISTNDLGPNNTRIITPKYGKAKTKPVDVAKIDLVAPVVALQAVAVTEAFSPSDALNIADLKASDEDSVSIVTTAKAEAVAPKVVVSDHVKIDIMSTYERVMDKGYKSVDMLKKVSDSHYFNGDLELSAKWYGELFSTTSDLDAVYYYRYAQSLMAVNQTDKANEMMKLFESKSL